MKTLTYHTRLALWLQEQMLPGDEEEFKAWLAQDPENRIEWEQLQQNIEKTKLLRGPNIDLELGWERVKREAGLRSDSRSSSAASKKRNRAKTKNAGMTPGDYLGTPLGLSIIAMVVFVAFLAFLKFIRNTIGF